MRVSILGCIALFPGLRPQTKTKMTSTFKLLPNWISLNACYAVSGDINGTREKTKLTEFFEKLINADQNRIHHLFWMKFSGVIRVLLNNQFIYNRCWLYQRGEALSWKVEFERENINALLLLQSPNRSVDLISLVMNRL